MLKSETSILPTFFLRGIGDDQFVHVRKQKFRDAADFVDESLKIVWTTCHYSGFGNCFRWLRNPVLRLYEIEDLEGTAITAKVSVGVFWS